MDSRMAHRYFFPTYNLKHRQRNNDLTFSKLNPYLYKLIDILLFNGNTQMTQ